ncbi:MAG: DUF4143 domain-containing protein [Gammaproteobacteria bacterium]|nr:DUF4143 domain-containing protein [Gammaproteobacteria bacterium]
MRQSQVCYLPGISEPEQLRHHPLRGAIFESWVVSEIFKSQVHSGEQPSMYRYRESRGAEIDLLVDRGEKLYTIEIKSAAMASTKLFRHFSRLPERIRSSTLPSPIENRVVYGGVQTIGVDEIAWKKGHKYLTLVYQIDSHCKRLL